MIFVNMGRSSWSGEKPPHVFREDPATTDVVSVNCWAAYRTGTLNFDFLIAFPPLKVTTFKLFFDLKSRLGGIMVSKAFPKPRFKGSQAMAPGLESFQVSIGK